MEQEHLDKCAVATMLCATGKFKAWEEIREGYYQEH